MKLQCRYFLPLAMLLSLFPFHTLEGQGDALSRKEQKKLVRQEKIDLGKLMSFPFAALAYTPELGPTLIGVMMFSFKTDP